MCRILAHIQDLNVQVEAICALLAEGGLSSDPPAASYADAIKKQSKAVEQVKQTIKQDQAKQHFERDKKEAQASLFIPAIKEILSNVDVDMDNSSTSKVSKPTAEIIKTNLLWFLLSKATAHPDSSLLKRLPGLPDTTFMKVVLRQTKG